MPATGIVEIDRFASTISVTLSGSFSLPLTIQANQALFAGGSIAHSLVLGSTASTPISIDLTATPTSVPWFEVTRFYTVPSVAFNNGVAISFPSTRLTYGSSSVAITFSVTGSGSSTQLSALLTPSGTDFSFMEEIDVDVAVSYGNPFPIQLTTASFRYGTRSVAGTFSLTMPTSDPAINFRVQNFAGTTCSGSPTNGAAANEIVQNFQTSPSQSCFSLGATSVKYNYCDMSGSVPYYRHPLLSERQLHWCFRSNEPHCRRLVRCARHDLRYLQLRAGRPYDCCRRDDANKHRLARVGQCQCHRYDPLAIGFEPSKHVS